MLATLRWSWGGIAFLLAAWCGLTVQAEDLAPQSLASETPAERGYRWLTTKAYLPPDFDQQTFDEVWHAWEEPLRSQAEKATPDQRRRLALERYGLTARPGDPSARPQQYVVDADGNWCMNCLACHQGKVAGRIIPGLPNSLYALETLTEEIRATKLRLGKELTRMDIGLMFIPLGTTNGTTNAVNFGVALMSRRDADLNVITSATAPKLVHHDHDAPAWWHMHNKRRIYCDGFADRGAQALMQFMLIKENGPEKFRAWEADFKDVEAWIDALRAPAYPFAIDRALAEQGSAVYAKHCAECHGTYDAQPQLSRADRADRRGTDRSRAPGFPLAGASAALCGELVQPVQGRVGRGRSGGLRGAAVGRRVGHGSVLSQRLGADAVALAASGGAARRVAEID